MRLIDADALKKAIIKRLCIKSEMYLLASERSIYNLIDEQPTIEQPKWIPVSERKPKSMANKVIVYLEHEDLNPMIGYGHFERFQGEEMWYNLETCEQFSKHGYTVTYWMPMPKSPDGKTLILC